MVTSELNQSNHVTNRQYNFGQPILKEGIPTGFKLKTSKLVQTVRNKNNQLSKSSQENVSLRKLCKTD